MRGWFGLIALLLRASAVLASQAAANPVIVHGKVDGHAPAWSIMTDQPQGWTSDCCTYASAIGVNLVFYQGDWTGKPDRVIVLNVWPAKLPTLDADVQDDRKHYLQSDPHAGHEPFAVKAPLNTACAGMLYRGTDHLDDAVVFCDPGKASGIRYSWSVTIAANDAQRQAVLDAFKLAVENSRYMQYSPSPASTGHATTH